MIRSGFKKKWINKSNKRKISTLRKQSNLCNVGKKNMRSNTKPLAKKSKVKISVVQRKLWELCKQIVRLNYPNICYTCGQTNLIGTNCQTGHLWAKASLSAFLKYDLRVLRIQCARCNLFLGGMGAEFYVRMLKEIGPEAMEKLQSDRQVTVKAIVKAIDHYLKLTSEYQVYLENLIKNHDK